MFYKKVILHFAFTAFLKSIPFYFFISRAIWGLVFCAMSFRFPWYYFGTHIFLLYFILLFYWQIVLHFWGMNEKKKCKYTIFGHFFFLHHSQCGKNNMLNLFYGSLRLRQSQNVYFYGELLAVPNSQVRLADLGAFFRLLASMVTQWCQWSVIGSPLSLSTTFDAMLAIDHGI